MILIDAVSKRFKAPAPKASGLSGLAGVSALLRKREASWVEAVRNVSLTAADGRITGLLGPNGAGKTTTLRMLAGLFEPDHGRISVDGLPVTGQNPAALSRMGILGDAHGLYPRLTARENIIYFGRLQGMAREEAEDRAEVLSELLDLKKVIDRRADGFSQGERMKTALARALVHDPANIVLDEPTNGLDVLATRALREALRVLAREQGKCIVFSTHIMQEVEYLCDEVVVVARGTSVARGSVPELKQQAGCERFEDAFVALAFPESTPEAA
ncbi:ABC transporter ATP-binding protein [Inhella gelatinilytica]|uniref:ATP-binding cassette domain-containing protein n=1 Tax=Inhella gelatinilytica TaxID=2795030 RepID=A0A931IW61_9BURK|nr:ATP-binding cassette domain-containing protein [Inhella gelatinilytica]MBH9552120.1 ATP-binding cassette domain-containing protein [Inhella gelatinilytica]